MSLGMNGYLFTPDIWARGLVECPFCQDQYINMDYFTAHLAADHSAQERDEYRRMREGEYRRQGRKWRD